MIELYFPIHGSIELKHILPLLLVAKYLKQAGIMTRINILRMYHEKSKLFVMYGYPIKDYGDEIDFNEIALNGVDGRWWAAMQVMVRALNDQDEAKTYLNMNVKPGTAMRYYDGAGSEAGSHNDYAEVFSRYRNWYMDQIKQGLMPPLRVDKKLILFGGVWEGYGSMEEMKDEIIGEFFRVLDTVDFQFNNAEQTCKRIYKRRVTDKLAEFYRNTKEPNAVNPITQKAWTTQEIVIAMEVEKDNLTYKFRTYVQGLLNTTYSYPVEGFYAEPEESAKKLDDEFEEKLEDLNKFLKTV
jgi:L-rhamnose mutarotase